MGRRLSNRNQGKNMKTNCNSFACILFQAVVLVTCQLLSPNAVAGQVTLTFEGLGDFEYTRDFYNGGLAVTINQSSGSGPGPAYGISFPGDTITYINNGPSGAHFGGQPTPITALSFQQSGAWMNVASGFVGGLSFYYANPNNDSTISIYSEVNGGGQRLATLFLPVTTYETTSGQLFPAQFTSVSFSGIARSVDFIKLAHSGYVDDLTIDIPSVVPEPSIAALTIFGLAVVGSSARRGRRNRTKSEEV